MISEMSGKQDKLITHFLYVLFKDMKFVGDYNG